MGKHDSRPSLVGINNIKCHCCDVTGLFYILTSQIDLKLLFYLFIAYLHIPCALFSYYCL